MTKSPNDRIEATGSDFDPIVHEISIMKQIILERYHSLDLIRELVSNAAAKEVGATEIRIKYTVDDTGHIFEVTDNGCGMDYTNDPGAPGRLDRFFGLGLSNIVGIKGDEFSWKGLGSKLAYHSRAIEIHTSLANRQAYRVEINDPWSTIERGFKPKPKIFKFQEDSGTPSGTTIKVSGHPPHRQDEPFSFEEIENYLRHRTFIGFTGHRDNAPTIFLSVLGKSKELPFGFQELHEVDLKTAPEGTLPIDKSDTFTKSGTNRSLQARLRGFITWDAEKYHLNETQLNCGLILSVKGIPYFNLDMEEFGSRSIGISNPGWKKCCLIIECDAIQQDMNIARSDLVDSERVDMLKQLASRLFQGLEKSPDYLAFRQVPKKRKTIKGADNLATKKTALESPNQKWVVWKDPNTNKNLILSREPQNEYDALIVLWKLEALGALPFKQFQTLGHAGDGPDLIVHFQEDGQSNPDRYTSIEAENRFSNYHAHGHTSSLYPRVVAWDLGSSKKMRITQTEKSYKVIAARDDLTVHVYLLRRMPGVQILDRAQLGDT
jgi:hypothetical protein